MTDFPIFVQTPRQLFNLTLAELELVQRPPATPAAPAVVRADWNLLTDSYELLTTCWDELLPVARFAAGVRAGADAMYAPDDTWGLGKRGADSEGFGAAFEKLADVPRSLPDVFDSSSEFRTLAREFREKVFSAAFSPQSRIAALRWLGDTTEAISELLRSSRAEAVLYHLNADSHNLEEPADGSASGDDALRFDIEGIASWASVLGLTCAEEFSEMASLGLVDLPTPNWYPEHIEELAYHMSDARQMLETYFKANGLMPSVDEGVASIVFDGGKASVVSRVPPRFTEEEVWDLVAIYCDALAGSSNTQELALLVLEAQGAALPIETHERLVAEADTQGRSLFDLSVDHLYRVPRREGLIELRGYVRGVLEERQRHGDDLAVQTVQLLQEFRDFRQESKDASHLLYRESRRTRELLERGLPASWEAGMKAAVADAAASRDWEKAVEQLLRRGASRAAGERLDERYGDRWEQLGRDSRDNLLALEVMMADHVPALSELATVGLFRVFEPELKAVLAKADAEVARPGTLRELIDCAAGQPNEMLRTVAAKCLEEDVVSIRNAGAHGGKVTDEQFQRMRWLLLDPKVGLLWMLLDA